MTRSRLRGAETAFLCAFFSQPVCVPCAFPSGHHEQLQANGSRLPSLAEGPLHCEGTSGCLQRTDQGSFQTHWQQASDEW